MAMEAASASAFDRHFFQTETDLATAEARRLKAERTKHLGDPIQVPAKPLAIQVHGNHVWIAQSDALVKRINLETRKVVQVYRGHTAPVTTLALFTEDTDPNSPLFLVSGSWDKTVKIWDTRDKSLISSTEAHSDFVKCVYPIPELKTLVTSGADKVVRLWDLSDMRSVAPLKVIALITEHTRPVQCIAAQMKEPSAEAPLLSRATLYTADSMGLIKIWELQRTRSGAQDSRGNGTPITIPEHAANCRAFPVGELNVHRTGVNAMWYSQGQLWTASSDETVCLTHCRQVENQSAKASRLPPHLVIQHPAAARAVLPLALTPVEEPLLVTGAGDAIRLYDISSALSSPSDPPELLSTSDAHWMGVVALQVWFRKAEQAGRTAIEPWIVSASLDGTIRRWKLADLINPPKETLPDLQVDDKKDEPSSSVKLTAEEEAELAELMDDD